MSATAPAVTPPPHHQASLMEIRLSQTLQLIIWSLCLAIQITIPASVFSLTRILACCEAIGFTATPQNRRQLAMQRKESASFSFILYQKNIAFIAATSLPSQFVALSAIFRIATAQ